MMFVETVGLTMQTQKYDTTLEKNYEGTYSEKVPSTNHVPSLPPSTGPLTIEKPIPEEILCPPKSMIQEVIFNPSAQDFKFYNIIDDMAQVLCTISTLEVLQTCPTQRKNLLSPLGALDSQN